MLNLSKILAIIMVCVAAALPAAAAKPRPAATPDTLRFVATDTDREIISFLKSPSDTLPSPTEIITFTIDSVSTLNDYDLYETLSVGQGVISRDWIISIAGGAHAFFGDRSSDGSFGGTISPEATIAVGKWLSDCVGVAVEFTRSNSRGYTRHITGEYGFGHGPMHFLPDGTPYRAMKTSWWNLGANVMFNISRLVVGYEGIMSSQLMNQFFLELGGGCLHHLNYNQIYGNGYEWSAQIALRYSRFFNRSKTVSLDVKARWLMCFTNFDFESKSVERLIDRLDSNVGISIGVTCYIDPSRRRASARRTLDSYPSLNP